MKIKSKHQVVKLPVANFDQFVQGEGLRQKLHGALLPKNVRAVFFGPLNFGKTNALIALLTQPNGLKFENIYLYSKSLDQPKYKFLETLLKLIEGIGYFTFHEHEQVAKPEDTLPNSIMIFDSIMKLCAVCWNNNNKENKLGFLVIDKDSELNNDRYRKGFDCLISINADNFQYTSSVVL